MYLILRSQRYFDSLHSLQLVWSGSIVQARGIRLREHFLHGCFSFNGQHLICTMREDWSEMGSMGTEHYLTLVLFLFHILTSSAPTRIPPSSVVLEVRWATLVQNRVTCSADRPVPLNDCVSSPLTIECGLYAQRALLRPAYPTYCANCIDSVRKTEMMVVVENDGL